MTEISFTQTHNVFLDNGIVGLYRYLIKAERPDLLPSELDALKAFPLQRGIHFGLEPTRLWIKHNDLFALLEALYYGMGHEVFDTFTDKQLAEGGNLFFRQESDGMLTAHTFPKMNTYGLTELLTNNAQGLTKSEANTRKIDAIRKEEPMLAAQIEEAFTARKLKLLIEIQKKVGNLVLV